jgi:hypothetical protein
VSRFTADDATVVATGAVVLGLASLPWYEAPLAIPIEYAAWDLGVLGLAPVLLSAYAALRVLWLGYRPLGPEVPLAPGVEPFAACVLATVLMVVRVLDAPHAFAQRTEWLWVAAVVVAVQLLAAARTVVRSGIRAPSP